MPAVGLAEASRRGDEHERGDAIGVVHREPQPHGPAHRDAGIRESLDAEVVRESEDEAGDVADGGVNG